MNKKIIIALIIMIVILAGVAGAGLYFLKAKKQTVKLIEQPVVKQDQRPKVEFRMLEGGKGTIGKIPVLITPSDPNLPPDTDQDGLSDQDEQKAGTNPTVRDSDADGIDDIDEKTWATDPLKSDTDGDGIKDGEEIRVGSNPLQKGK